MSDHPAIPEDQEVPPEVMRRLEAAQAEETAWLSAQGANLRTFQTAHITYLAESSTWLSSRCVDLNIAVREKEEELTSLRSQLAAYQRSEAIDQAASDEPRSEPPTP